MPKHTKQTVQTLSASNPKSGNSRTPRRRQRKQKSKTTKEQRPTLVHNNTTRAVQNAAGSLSLSRQLKERMLHFALPAAMPPMRQAVQYESKETAIASPYNFWQVTWGENNTTQQLKSDQTFLAVSRNPLQAVAYWYSNTSTVNVPPNNEYYFYFWNDHTNEQTDTQHIILTTQGPIAPLFPIQCYADPDAVGPHGSTYFPVDIDEAKAVWLDYQVGIPLGHSTASFHCRIYGGNLDCNGLVLQVWKYKNNKWTQSDNIPATAVDPVAGAFCDFVFTNDERAYYSFEVVTTAFNPAQNQYVDFGITGYFTFLPMQVGFLPIPDLPSIAPSVNAIRVNGVSAMITQTSTVLAQGGRAIGLQIPGRTLDSIFSGATQFDMFGAISALQGAVQKPLATGIYGYHRPANPDEFKMVDVFGITAGEPCRISNPVVEDWLYLVASVPPGSTTSSLASFTVCFEIEFQTSSKMFATGYPEGTVAETTEAFNSLHRLPQIYENALHFRDIMSALRGGAKKVLSATPLLSSLATSLFGMPELSPLISAPLTALGSAL